MFKQLKKHIISVAFVSLIISIVSVALSYYTITQANNLTRKTLEFEIDKRSEDEVDKAYEIIYWDDQLLVVLDSLKNNTPTNNQKDLTKLINVLEGIGFEFC